MDLQLEIWKDIPGYEGLYQASNLGRIKGLKRKVSTGNNGYRIIKEQIKKPVLQKSGYYHIALYKNCKRQEFNVHKIILMTFNPVKKNEETSIDHIDMNKTNNSLNNLEWVTPKENNRRMWDKKPPKTTLKKTLASSKNIQIAIEKSKKKVAQYKNNKLICVYNSISDAARKLNIQGSHIGKCCKNKYGFKTCGGYEWRYYNE